MANNKFILITILLFGLIMVHPFSVALADSGGDDFGGGGGDDSGGGGDDFGGGGGDDFGGGGGDDYGSDAGDNGGGDNGGGDNPAPAPVPVPIPVPVPVPVPAPNPAPDDNDNNRGGGGGGGGGGFVPTPISRLNPKLSIQKTVRNISQNTPYQETVNAAPGENLSFKIKVESTNNSVNEEAHNVIVRDILPEGINFQGNLRINDEIPAINFNVSNIPLGIFVRRQIKTITFDAKLSPKDTFNFGLTTMINRAGVKADNFTETFDQAIVKVNIPGKVLGATDVVTGTNVFYVALAGGFVLAILLYFLIFYLDNSRNPFIRKVVRFLVQFRLFMFR